MQIAESIRHEMMGHVRAAGIQLAPHASIKTRRNAVARATKLAPALIDRIWYGNITRVDAAVADTIRNLIGVHKSVEQAQETTKDLRTEIAALRERLDRILELIEGGEL